MKSSFHGTVVGLPICCLCLLANVLGCDHRAGPPDAADGGDAATDVQEDDVDMDDGMTVADEYSADGGVVEDGTAVGEEDDFFPEDAPDAGPDGQDGGEDGQTPMEISCALPPPPHAMRPAPFPHYEGTCPVLKPGRNTIQSSGRSREFVLVVPAELNDQERLPLLFLWHWLGGEADDFLEKGDVQMGADQMRFLAAIPEARGDLLFKWPFLISDGESRMEEEVRLFDDLLACIAEQFRVNADCVGSIGVSAGGLWTAQLAQRRAQHLSSFLSLSGGVGKDGDWLNPVRSWRGAAQVMPAVVLWGGPADFCGLSFSTTSGYLEEALVNGGHFIVECIHNCAHAEPPVEAEPGKSRYACLWEFVLHHPFWLRDGESPYLERGLPASFPDWCAIGRGKAQIRQGKCEGGVLGDCL